MVSKRIKQLILKLMSRNEARPLAALGNQSLRVSENLLSSSIRRNQIFRSRRLQVSRLEFREEIKARTRYASKNRQFMTNKNAAHCKLDIPKRGVEQENFELNVGTMSLILNTVIEKWVIIKELHAGKYGTSMAVIEPDQ